MADETTAPEKTEEELRQEVAEAWRGYVRKEINSYLDSFLEIADKGTIGVKYAFRETGHNEDGSVAAVDIKEAKGVQLLINFEFETPLYFTNEEGLVE